MLLDFILIFTIIICVFLGYKNGITQMLVSIVIFIFSIALVVQIYNHLEIAFFDSEFGSEMVQSVSDNINGKIDKFRAEITTDAPFLGKYFIEAENRRATENTVRELSKKSIRALLTIPLVILSFILLKTILKLVKFLASKTRKLPIIGGIDAFLGSICGLVTGIIMVCVIYMLVCYLQFLPSVSFLERQIDDSLLVMIISDFLNK